MSKQYYRMQDTKLTVGQIIKGGDVRPLEDDYPAVERVLEENRPTDQPDRAASVYMVEEREFALVGLPYDVGYVHTMEPVGNVHKRDTKWLGALQERHPPNTVGSKNPFPELTDDQLAQKYWSGQASPTPAWEWVAREATVVAVDDHPTRIKRHFGKIGDILSQIRAENADNQEGDK